MLVTKSKRRECEGAATRRSASIQSRVNADWPHYQKGKGGSVDRHALLPCGYNWLNGLTCNDIQYQLDSTHRLRLQGGYRINKWTEGNQTQSIFRDIQLTPTDEYSYLVDALVALLSWVSRVLATAMSAGSGVSNLLVTGSASTESSLRVRGDGDEIWLW